MDMEAIKAQLDMLVARSWAQETLLLFLAQRAGADEFGFVMDVERYSQQLRDHLRHSPLTDSQIAHFDLAMRALLERLRLLGEKEDPSMLGLPD